MLFSAIQRASFFFSSLLQRLQTHSRLPAPAHSSGSPQTRREMLPSRWCSSARIRQCRLVTMFDARCVLYPLLREVCREEGRSAGKGQTTRAKRQGPTAGKRSICPQTELLVILAAAQTRLPFICLFPPWFCKNNKTRLARCLEPGLTLSQTTIISVMRSLFQALHSPHPSPSSHARAADNCEAPHVHCAASGVWTARSSLVPEIDMSIDAHFTTAHDLNPSLP